MARRIEIELTAARDGGTWSWRAAGAREPKGVLDGDLLYEGAKAGDVVRAEADFEVDGITIISVVPPKERRQEPSRLEVRGTQRDTTPVTTVLARPGRQGRRDGGDWAGNDRPRRDRAAGDRSGERRGSRDQDRGPAANRSSRPPGAAGGRGQEAERGHRQPSGSPEEAQHQREGLRPRREAGERAGGGRSAAGRGRPDGERGRGDRDPGTHDRGRGQRRPAWGTAGASDRPGRPDVAREKRLSAASTHRNAVLEGLPPEQRPVAEQVLRGGLAAVRAAIAQENERAAAEGRPAVNADAFVAMAEELLPKLKAAEWHDRAEAAARAVDDVSLRDLRAVVAGADAGARDEETRGLAGTLREALERRVVAQRQQWAASVGQRLEEGRVVEALRLSAHPPDPACRCPADIAARLSGAAGAAMTPDLDPERWAELLDAVVASPVRRSVRPAGLPANPGETLLHSARQAAGRVPALAAMLGIDMPPPPGPHRPVGGRPPSGRPNRPPSPRPPAPRRPPAGPAPAGPPASAPERAGEAADEAAGQPIGDPAAGPTAGPADTDPAGATLEPEPSAAER
jgi:hypothetical protein